VEEEIKQEEMAINPIVVEVPSAAVEVLLTTDSDDVRSKIRELTKSISEAYWDLSQLIYRVAKEKLFAQWGFKNFDTWANAELGFARRKVYYLLSFAEYCTTRIQQRMQDDQLAQQVISEIRQIGWTKASRIAEEDVLNKDNFKNVLDAAKLPINDFNSYVGHLKNGDAGAPPPYNPNNKRKEVTLRSFKLTDEQNAVITRTFERVRKVSSRTDLSDGQCLEFVCAEFDGGGNDDIGSYLSILERVLGVSLIAFSDDSKTLLYGLENMERIVGEK
jgi:hypothetical protein